jgi:hypothetical protein
MQLFLRPKNVYFLATIRPHKDVNSLATGFDQF